MNLKIATAKSALLICFLGLAGCQGSGATSAALNAIVAEQPSIVPEPSATPSPSPSASPVASYTVLKNWGWAGSAATTNGQMPLNFTTMSLGAQTGFVLWYQYQPGFHGVNGKEYRRCRAKFLLNGSADMGVLTISDTEVVWSMNSAESVNFTACPSSLDGNYNYVVDANGLSLDGVMYSEVL